MATGPSHYREAERLLREASEGAIGIHGERVYLDCDEIDRRIARAQIHATLAVAWSTAMGVIGEYVLEPDDLAREWAEVAK